MTTSHEDDANYDNDAIDDNDANDDAKAAEWQQQHEDDNNDDNDAIYDNDANDDDYADDVGVGVNRCLTHEQCIVVMHYWECGIDAASY